MSSLKVMKQMQKQTEKKSLVKDLISLHPVSSVVITETHPLQTLYNDSNPPPHAVDQFAPYLSKKLLRKRKEKIERIKGTPIKDSPTFALTAQRSSITSPARTPRKTTSVLENLPSFDEYESRPRTRAGSPKKSETLQQHLKMEQTFDKIASSSHSIALHKLIESTLQFYFLADNVYYFHDISSVKVLYCPTTTGNCPHMIGIAGYTQYSREIQNCDVASMHSSYSQLYEASTIPPDSHILAFPLFDFSNNVKGIVEIIRNKTSPVFTKQDEEFVEYFQQKCKIYSRWLFQPILDDTFASELIQTCRLKQYVELVSDKLTKLFSCRSAEIWSFNQQTNSIQKYSTQSDKPIDVPPSEAGIAGYSLKHQIPVSCIQARVHSAYVQKADGNGDFSVLVIPVRDPDSSFIYAVLLRGKRLPQFFTDNDEKILSRIIPYVITSLNSASIAEKNYSELQESLRQQGRLRSLLEVAEILSGELNMDSLIPKIMQRACDLVKADRCSLFMATEARDKLITTFTGGMKDAIELPFKAGIVGYTASTGEILNIKDAYEDPRFNRATDLKTGYRTLTLLCVPIFDHRGMVRGVTEMINKLDGTFTDEDVKLIQIFNVFTGISLENAQLYRASIDLSVQLKTLMDISVSITQQQSVKKLLEEIIRNTRAVIGCVTAALFLIDENGISSKPTIIDEDTQSKMELYEKQKKKEERDTSLGVKRALIMRLMQGKTPGQEELTRDEEERNIMISKVVETKESTLENDAEHPERSMMLAPILGTDRILLGVVMMQWKKNQPKFTIDDMKLLESYSVFLSISLERSRLKKIAQMGSSEVEMQNWMTKSERESPCIPHKLSLSEEDLRNVVTKDFNIELFRGIGLIRTIFYIFNRFDLLKEFQINAETLYRFVHELRSSYNQVPYHNWNHAVDVSQFVAYTIIQSGLDQKLTKLEILTLIVSALCHDANHDGFSNQYNVRAQTPLGILFKNQSVMETHHCSVSIGILTKEENNIFASLSDAQLQSMWQMFISLILATDMAKHFQYVDAADELIKSQRDWSKDPKDRMLVMELIIKVADVSNCARKFDIADKWVDVLCEEFFIQGDLERAAGLEYSSPMNDREHLDKAKSQIGFYKSVCLPLFTDLAEILPNCNDIVTQIESNLNEWQQRARSKSKERLLENSQSSSSEVLPVNNKE